MADNPLKKVWAYRKSDGHKVYVPEHYLDIPEFDLRRTPLERSKSTSTTDTKTKTKAEEATR